MNIDTNLSVCENNLPINDNAVREQELENKDKVMSKQYKKNISLKEIKRDDMKVNNNLKEILIKIENFIQQDLMDIAQLEDVLMQLEAHPLFSTMLKEFREKNNNYSFSEEDLKSFCVGVMHQIKQKIIEKNKKNSKTLNEKIQNNSSEELQNDLKDLNKEKQNNSNNNLENNLNENLQDKLNSNLDNLQDNLSEKLENNLKLDNSKENFENQLSELQNNSKENTLNNSNENLENNKKEHTNSNNKVSDDNLIKECSKLEKGIIKSRQRKIQNKDKKLVSKMYANLLKDFEINKYQDKFFIEWLGNTHPQQLSNWKNKNRIPNEIKESYDKFIQLSDFNADKICCIKFEELSKDQQWNILNNLYKADGIQFYKNLSTNLKKNKLIISLMIEYWGDYVLNEIPSDVLFNNNEYNNLEQSIIFNALKNNGYLLANKRIQNNFNNHEKFVAQAVAENGLALKFVSNELKENKDICLIAVKSNAFAYNFIAKSLKNDKDIIYCAILQNPNILKFIKKEFYINDKELFIKLVQIKGGYLKYASESLKNDMEVVSLALQNDGYALQYVGEYLINNYEVIFKAIKQNANAILCLKVASELIKSMRFVLEALKYNGMFLQHIPNASDENIILQAIKQNPLAIKYAHKDFLSDINIAKQILNTHPLLFKYFHKDIQENPEILKIIIEQDITGEVLNYVNMEILCNYNDGELILLALNKNLNNIKYFKNSVVTNNHCYVLMAAIQKLDNLKYGSNTLLIEMLQIISQELINRNKLDIFYQQFFNKIENINFKNKIVNNNNKIYPIGVSQLKEQVITEKNLFTNKLYFLKENFNL